MYLNVNYVIATQKYEFFNIYAEAHWKYHTFEGSYTCTCSFSKLRHKAYQKVWKCSLTFPLKNGIVTFYENCTNKYVTVDKLGGWYPPPLLTRLVVPYMYIRYNFWMAWAIITISTSKCAKMDNYLKRQNLIANAKSVISKNLRGWVPPPLFSRKVKIEFCQCHFLEVLQYQTNTFTNTFLKVC